MPEGVDLLSAREVPELDRPVPTPAGEGAAIRAEGHTHDRVLVPEGSDLLSAREVPELDRLIPTSAGEGGAIRAEGHCGDPFFMRAKRRSPNWTARNVAVHRDLHELLEFRLLFLQEHRIGFPELLGLPLRTKSSKSQAFRGHHGGREFVLLHYCQSRSFQPGFGFFVAGLI